MFSFKTILWLRKKAFRKVSTLKVLECIAECPLEWQGVVPLPDLLIRPVKEGFTAHIGLSVHHKKSELLYKSLTKAYPDIKIKMIGNGIWETSDFKQCERPLFVLSDGCLKNKAHTDHIREAIRLRDNKLILEHASPACGGVPFAKIMEQCPADLKELGLFDTLASELVEDEDYLKVVLHEIASHFVEEADDEQNSEDEDAVAGPAADEDAITVPVAGVGVPVAQQDPTGPVMELQDLSGEDTIPGAYESPKSTVVSNPINV
jgi:hypothetical protein